MSSEIAISVRNLTKRYSASPSPVDRLKDFVMPKRAHKHIVGALENVSFDVHRGETVGIVGRNGSGKSTLLQIIVGTLFQTSGDVTTNGVVTGLLEIGTAFDGEFTGRENVELYGAVLGKSREEIDSQVDAIVEFSEIGDFISQPVRTYSSGMSLRLAFSTAIMVEPDILVIDEALAVGDQSFREKCFSRLAEIRDQGATILFVSHAAATIIDLCDRAILLDQGELLFQDEPEAVMQEYSRLIAAPLKEKQKVRDEIIRSRSNGSATDGEVAAAAPAATPSKPTHESPAFGRVAAAHIESVDGVRVETLDPGQEYVAKLTLHLSESVVRLASAVDIMTKDGVRLGGFHGEEHDVASLIEAEGGRITVDVSFRCFLTPGSYALAVSIGAVDGGAHSAPVTHKLAFDVATQARNGVTGPIDFGFEAAITPH